jgi:hypothetical protein
VGVEVILHQHDLRRVGKMRVGQILERMGVIDGGAAVGHLHMPRGWRFTGTVPASSQLFELSQPR